MSISVVVIAKDAEKTIVKVLKSVQFADEIILVDINSTDKTIKLADELCSKVFPYGKDSLFVEPVRNFALEKASKEWILILDADEEIPESLAKELVRISEDSNSSQIYHLSRKNIVSGYWMQHTGWWPDYQLRFFKKGLVTWSDTIHSRPLINGKNQTEFLEARGDLAILHHNYQDTRDYLARFDRYTDIEAIQKSEVVGNDFIISNSTLLQSFSDDFLRRFFQKEGYLDGARGFYLSIMQAAYQMTVQMKIFDLLGNKADLEKNHQDRLANDLHRFKKDLNYWIGDFEINQKNGIAKLFAIIRRKLSL